MAYRGKRLLDLLIAVPALIVLTPILIVVALLVRRNFGKPVLFRQVRPGMGGRPFTLYKFRTMHDTCDSHGRLLSDAARLTPFGNFLRSTSLDELPELFNIIRGDMSLVGPRPLLYQYLSLYTPEQARRHEVKPGLTGWAQINGRNGLAWKLRFDLDTWYVDHQSLLLDLRILLLTVHRITIRQGINQPGEATVFYFQGNHTEGEV